MSIISIREYVRLLTPECEDMSVCIFGMVVENVVSVGVLVSTP